jgi:putative nucleotidyltransferase with HDIG domain
MVLISCEKGGNMRQVYEQIKDKLLSASCVELNSIMINSLTEIGLCLNAAQINVNLLEDEKHQYLWMRIGGKKEYPIFENIQFGDDDSFFINCESKNEFSEDIIHQLVFPLRNEGRLIGLAGFLWTAENKMVKEVFDQIEQVSQTFSLVLARKIKEDRALSDIHQMEKIFMQTVEAFSSIVEISDPYTSGHQSRTGELARAIAKKMNLGYDAEHAVYLASLLHDLGKFYIPAQILNKPGKLTEIEYSLIKTHPSLGYQILKKIDFPWPIADIVLQHHEKVNGSGYPYGMLGDDIMIEAKILCVADVVESISSHRPYRPALGLDSALFEIKEKQGTLYDVDVVEATLDLFIKDKYQF